MTIDATTIARAHGGFNLVGGLWPLLNRRGFEAMFGHKRDGWLLYTVAGLLTVVGWAQLRSADERHPGQARRLGVGTAAWLLAIDLTNVLSGRIARTYLLDAAAEAGWLLAWSRVAKRGQASGSQGAG